MKWRIASWILLPFALIAILVVMGLAYIVEFFWNTGVMVKEYFE